MARLQGRRTARESRAQRAVCIARLKRQPKIIQVAKSSLTLLVGRLVYQSCGLRCGETRAEADLER